MGPACCTWLLACSWEQPTGKMLDSTGQWQMGMCHGGHHWLFGANTNNTLCLEKESKECSWATHRRALSPPQPHLHPVCDSKETACCSEEASRASPHSCCVLAVCSSQATETPWDVVFFLFYRSNEEGGLRAPSRSQVLWVSRALALKREPVEYT